MKQKIATRVPAPPSLIALGLDDYSDWDDQHSPALRPTSNDSAYSSSATSPPPPQQLNAIHAKQYSNTAIASSSSSSSAMPRYHTVFSEDEDDSGPSASGSSLAAAGNMFSSLLPSSMRSSSHQQQSMGFMDPVLISPAYHIHQADNALSTLKQVVRDDGWKKALKHKSGVVVHMKQGIHKGDKTPIFKGQAIIHGFSPQSIFYVIGMRRLWDESYEDGNLVENLNDTTSLTYEVSKATATSKSRDLSLVEKIECSQDGTITFACTSVESPRLPKVPGRVRAQVKLQGWILEPTRGPTPATRVTFVVQETIKGWMPGFTKKSLARRPLAIAAVNEYLQRKTDRMRAQSKSSHHRPSVFGPTLEPRPHRLNTQHPSPTTSLQSFESSVSPTPSPTNSQRSILTDNNNTTNPTTKKRITFADQDKAPTSDNENNPGSSSKSNTLSLAPPTTTTIPGRHLYPSQRHPKKKVESLETLKRLSATLDDWTKKGERDGVDLYTRSENGKALFLRGDCIIEGGWTAEQLCSVIHCFGARKIWDERFEDGKIHDRFSQKEYLVQWWLRNMFPVNSTDISAITSIDTDATTGTIYTASTSVIDANIPVDETKPCVRGHTDLNGWVFTPLLDERGRTKSVKVTMVCNMDYKCDNIPANTAKVIQDEMFACVANVRDYVEEYGCPPYIRRVAGKVAEEEFESKTGTYQVTYIAKHEPSHSYRARRSGWCTDIRFHRSVYPQGLDVKVSPSNGTRVEMSSDNRSIRIFTTSSEMEGKRVVVQLTTEHRAKHEKTSSTQEITTPQKQEEHATAKTIIEEEPNNNPLPSPVIETKDEQITQPQQQQHEQPSSPTTTNLSTHPLNPSHPIDSATTPLSPTSHISTESSQAQVPKGYMLVPQTYQNNNIVIISDELTFNGQQLAVIFLAMVFCYYMGKFACTCG
ncbi:hypothetical protein O0I10_003020 [Lichtheimia ornata]|uniref:START domain-containing protein n=1 Tax=Lichtheimia ornata TaxID=688661 RepID=A0AAD7VBS2_9FUNG|nr:uncharacterized protein O0I10_003020 [Lichtheimia ornata]KAJ8661271.1 hypothetical protein O0I10_003020 [Lichtheimia ornata]